MNDIPVYDLKQLSLQDIVDLIEKDVVFDIDNSLFKEDPMDPIQNHFFDPTITTQDLF